MPGALTSPGPAVTTCPAHSRIRVRGTWRPRSPRESFEGDPTLTPQDADADEVVSGVLSRALPARQREVLVLRYYADLPETQIAAVLGISRGSVKVHAARARDALRTALADPAPST